MWSHEGSTDKINSIKREFKWKPAKASRFHDWLGKTYPFEKDRMSIQELRAAAREFEQGDRDQWND